MKYLFLFLGFIFFSGLMGCDTLQQAAGQVGGTASNTTPTSNEIHDALKQALAKGIDQGVNKVSSVNGFLKDAAIKILFPPDAQKVEKTLRGLGFNDLCDNFIASVNHAAEKAAGKAVPIFSNALKQMTFQDAKSILLGSDTSATHYFKLHTTSQLLGSFKPVIDSSLEAVGATRYWSQLITQYNKLPLVKDVNPDLSDYVTQKATNGLFLKIGDEEKKIRQQLTARTTPLMQKVFGYAQQIEGK